MLFCNKVTYAYSPPKNKPYIPSVGNRYLSINNKSYNLVLSISPQLCLHKRTQIYSERQYLYISIEELDKEQIIYLLLTSNNFVWIPDEELS